LSEKRKNERHWQSRTDTILGPGVRIEGSVRFSGVLRTMGDIVGDVTAEGDNSGGIVVSKSGSVTGTIRAAHVVVCGRLQGDAQASDSLEIQSGGSVTGDVSYRRIVIRPDGVINGALVPMAGHEAAGATDPSASDHVPATEDTGLPAALMAADPVRRRSAVDWRRIGMVAAVLVVAVIVVLMTRNSTLGPRVPADDAVAVEAPPPAIPVAALPVPAKPEAVKIVAPPAEATKVAASVVEPEKKAAPVPPPPQPATVAEKPVPAPARATPAPAADHAVVIEGDNADKSADFVFVACKAPCVLFKKDRQDAGEGARMALSPGARKRVAVGPDELLRVAEGQDVDMFFQGRKVSRQTLQSGTWMRFAAKSGAQ
jgi:cytoskeletal protein CcmA (bactofilin family)